MPRPEYEPQPNEMDPLRRYYADVLFKEDSYVDLQIAAEKFITDEVGEPSHGFGGLYGSILPTADHFRINPRISLDLFRKMPLDIVSPWIDLTKGPNELSAWYSSIASKIRIHTEDSHDDGCFTATIDGTTICKHSVFCPRKALVLCLEQPVLQPDYSSVNYLLDPYRAKGVAIEKMAIARKAGLVAPIEHDVRVSRYARDFEQRYGPAPLTPENGY